MARGGRGTFAFVAAFLMIVPSLTMGLPALAGTQAESPDTTPRDGEAWIDETLDALAWSTDRKDTLLAPLVGGTANLGWKTDLITSYDDGRTWAQDRLETADRDDLRDAVDRLLTLVLDDASPPGLDLARLGIQLDAQNIDDVPEPYIAPLATLLDAQHQLALDNDQETPAEDPWTGAQHLAERGAWLLGVVDEIRPALHDARGGGDQPTEPLPLDPLGLIILGSPGDDTYDGHTINSIYLEGPILAIEPGGDDTYNVPMAYRTYIDTQIGLLGIFESFYFDISTIAIDLAGDDAYKDRAAVAEQYTLHLLLDENGNDTYGRLNQARSVAAADAGYTMLADKAGNDTYQTAAHGLGYAKRKVPVGFNAIAVLADWQGDDAYYARTSHGSGRTHASAENAGAVSILRDYRGDDSYRARGLSYGRADNDANSMAWDDHGDDGYFIDILQQVSLGGKEVSEDGITSSPTFRSLGWFQDGHGPDRYDWRLDWDTTRDIGNGRQFTNTAPEYKYGIFTDCTTPDDALIPCQDEQRAVLEEIISGET